MVAFAFLATGLRQNRYRRTQGRGPLSRQCQRWFHLSRVEDCGHEHAQHRGLPLATERQTGVRARCQPEISTLREDWQFSLSNCFSSKTERFANITVLQIRITLQNLCCTHPLSN